MGRYEGTPDGRSAWEDEKRSKSGFKPMLFLGTCLAGLIFCTSILAIVVSLFGHRPDPADVYVVDVYGTDTCLLSKDANFNRESYEYQAAVVHSPVVFELCRKYKGWHVHVTYNDSSWRLETITAIP